MRRSYEERAVVLEALSEQPLELGAEVLAVVKSNEVILATEGERKGLASE